MNHLAQIQYEFNKNDEYYTPANAILPIIKYLKPNSSIWCPFDTSNSKYVQVLRDNGFTVYHSHISDRGGDFFTHEIPDCDYIISNPPYSRKGEVFKRLYEIGKPFAMLINFQGIFDHKGRFELFKNNRVELMYLSPRVNYIKPNQTKATGVPFQSGYLMSGISDEQLIFEYLVKEGEQSNT